jgi:hypothetical protein
VNTLNRQAAALRRLAAKATEEAEKHAGDADAAEEKLQKVAVRLHDWRELHEALVRAETATTDRQEVLKLTVERQRDLESRLDGSPAPTEADLEDARTQCTYLRSCATPCPACAAWRASTPGYANGRGVGHRVEEPRRHLL